MLIGIQDVIDWIDSNRTPFWKVKDGGGEKSNLIFSAKPDDSMPIALEDSKIKLRQSLEKLAPGNYFIQAWSTEGQKKEWNNTRFQLTGSGVQIGQNFNGSSQAPQVDVMKIVEEALQKERTANKLERLEADVKAKDARIKELEAELNSSQTRIGNRFEQILGPLFDMSTKTTPAAIGNLSDEGERIGNLMERWAAADANFEQPLKDIVHLAENNPSKYQMGKNLLK